MKRLSVIAFSVLAGALPAAASGIGPFSDFIIFGDSYSDGGNAAALTAGTSDPQPNPLFYPNQQFTNGDVWATQLGAVASELGGTNYAVGGAEAVAEVGDVSPDLATQIGVFASDLSGPLTLGPRPLATIFIGGNDVREANSDVEAQAIITESVTAIKAGMDALLSTSITEFAVFGLPNLGRLPGAVIDPALSLLATAATIEFNNTLQTMLAGFSGAADIYYVDTFGLFETIFGDPSAFGITNTTAGCILVELDPTACTADLGYFFQDALHATEPVHTVLADAFVRTIPPIPLPAGGILLLTCLGGLLIVRPRGRA